MKPGYKTTEFWLAILAIPALAFAGGWFAQMKAVPVPAGAPTVQSWTEPFPDGSIPKIPDPTKIGGHVRDVIDAVGVAADALADAFTKAMLLVSEVLAIIGYIRSRDNQKVAAITQQTVRYQTELQQLRMQAQHHTSTARSEASG